MPPAAQQPLPNALSELELVPDSELLEASFRETQAEVPLTPDTLSVRETDRLKAIRSPNLCRIIRTRPRLSEPVDNRRPTEPR